MKYAYGTLALCLGCTAQTIDESEVGSIEQAVIEGTPRTSDRHVMIENLNPQGNASQCSGTLLRNDVVLTARHCVTSNGNRDGLLVIPNVVRISQQDGTNVRAAEIRDIDTQTDVVLLRLVSPLAIDGVAKGGSSQMYDGDVAALTGEYITCLGYGRTTCNGGEGSLNSLRTWIEDTSTKFLDMVPNGWGQIVFRGDSGGSCLLDEPDLVVEHEKILGIVARGESDQWGNAGSTCALEANATRMDAPADSSTVRVWVKNQMLEWAQPVLWDFSQSHQGHFTLKAKTRPRSGPTAWTTTSSGLFTENSNFHSCQATPFATTDLPNSECYGDHIAKLGTHAIFDDVAVGDGWANVDVTSWDNDDAGLLGRYRDERNYYRFSVSRERSYARIVKVYRGNVSLVAEVPFSGVNYINWHTLSFMMWGGWLAGLVDGELVVWGYDTDLTAGKTGIYDWGLQDAVFDNFLVTHANPGDAL